MQIDRDKIEGMFLGIAIGDCLGMPVETWSAKKIADTYGRVTTYLKPDGHKWFDGHSAGTYTDDTQLSLTVAEAMIEADGLDMDVQVKYHIAALKKTTDGWGHTTRDSIRRLANGVNYKESGSGGDGSGTGNGVAMKLAPLAVLMDNSKFNEFLFNLNCMTHRTTISLAASFIHAVGIKFCLKNNLLPKSKYGAVLTTYDLHQLIKEKAEFAEEMGKELELHCSDDKISDQFYKLSKLLEETYGKPTDQQIIEMFKGSCYCFESVPFSYAFFFRNPTLECLFDVINAGGDTDSNGSIVGSLLGALHGKSIFPQYLIDGLVQKDEVLDVATRFADKFENKVFW